MIEVCSDHINELDRYRMLLQAGLLVRLMNKGLEESFVTVAVYINSDLVAERYLMYQPDKSQNVQIFIS